MTKVQIPPAPLFLTFRTFSVADNFLYTQNTKTTAAPAGHQPACRTSSLRSETETEGFYWGLHFQTSLFHRKNRPCLGGFDLTRAPF